MMGVADHASPGARSTSTSYEEWLEPLRKTFVYAQERSWTGYDPYDGLLSPLARLPVVRDSRLLRLALIQANKRSPWNLRELIRVPRGVNPKALALFLSAASRAPVEAGLRENVDRLGESLEQMRSTDAIGAGWGYHFPWQGRSQFLPAGTPTVVVTSFVGEAFLDAHAATGKQSFMNTALEACRFILEGLNRTEDDTGTCLSYSPIDRAAVYNASLLGARLLVLAGRRTGRPDLIREAQPLVRYALARQRPDGAWFYGESGHQRWIDSFHTGFVLGALNVYWEAVRDVTVRSAIEKGALFYGNHFFGLSGEPFYYSDRHYPFDIHSAAQGVLTFLKLGELYSDSRLRAESVGNWMVRTMLGPDGSFCYQVRRTGTVRIPYMRWSQAWGVRALAELARPAVVGHENLD